MQPRCPLRHPMRLSMSRPKTSSTISSPSTAAKMEPAARPISKLISTASISAQARPRALSQTTRAPSLSRTFPLALTVSLPTSWLLWAAETLSALSALRASTAPAKWSTISGWMTPSYQAIRLAAAKAGLSRPSFRSVTAISGWSPIRAISGSMWTISSRWIRARSQRPSRQLPTSPPMRSRITTWRLTGLAAAQNTTAAKAGSKSIRCRSAVRPLGSRASRKFPSIWTA